MREWLDAPCSNATALAMAIGFAYVFAKLSGLGAERTAREYAEELFRKLGGKL